MSMLEKETIEARKARELLELREAGILKRELPVISRSTFDSLPLPAQAEFMRAGGKFENDPAPERRPLKPGEVRRSMFDGLSPQAQMDFVKRGGRLVDDDEVIAPRADGGTMTREDYRSLLIREQVAFLDGGGQITD